MAQEALCSISNTTTTTKKKKKEELFLKPKAGHGGSLL
jgi:hypothetical protein